MSQAVLERMLPGFLGLFQKELMRYLTVPVQTVFGPVLASMLFLLVFATVFDSRAETFGDVSYGEFLLPGLAAMTMLQQSFSNPSSSLIVSKVTGNIVMILLTPISTMAFFLAYLLSSVVRGVMVAVLFVAAGAFFAPLEIAHPVWALVFLLLGGLMTSAMGVICGIWAERFDQIALFQSVVLLPLTFLSGVFYSLKSLPTFWQNMSLLNPFTYIIDGFRYGFLGHADNSVYISLLVCLLVCLALCIAAYAMIKSGYKLRG